MDFNKHPNTKIFRGDDTDITGGDAELFPSQKPRSGREELGEQCQRFDDRHQELFGTFNELLIQYLHANLENTFFKLKDSTPVDRQINYRVLFEKAFLQSFKDFYTNLEISHSTIEMVEVVNHILTFNNIGVEGIVTAIDNCSSLLNQKRPNIQQLKSRFHSSAFYNVHVRSEDQNVVIACLGNDIAQHIRIITESEILPRVEESRELDELHNSIAVQKRKLPGLKAQRGVKTKNFKERMLEVVQEQTVEFRIRCKES